MPKSKTYFSIWGDRLQTNNKHNFVLHSSNSPIKIFFEYEIKIVNKDHIVIGFPGYDVNNVQDFIKREIMEAFYCLLMDFNAALHKKVLNVISAPSNDNRVGAFQFELELQHASHFFANFKVFLANIPKKEDVSKLIIAILDFQSAIEGTIKHHIQQNAIVPGSYLGCSR